MSFKSKLNKGVSALAITALAATGCVEENREVEDTPEQSEAIESILEEIHDSCMRSPSDVDDLVCQLTDKGEPAAIVSLGCWSGKGWDSEPEELKSHYDQFNVGEDCEIVGAQY